jgi:hypothetical protein
MVTNSNKLAEISVFGPARATVRGTPLSEEELQKVDAYWRACCYLILGMLYLRENPLLREPLRVSISNIVFWAIGVLVPGNPLCGRTSTAL